MTIKLDPLVVQNEVRLAPTPQSQTGLSVPVLIDDTSVLDGDLFRTYLTPEQVDLDLAAAEISAFAAKALNTAFLRTPRPAAMVVAAVSAGPSATDSYVKVLDALSEQFFVTGFTITSRANSDISEVALAASARKKIFIAQSSDADFQTPGLPAALSSIEDIEFPAIVLHDDTNEPADFVMLARNLSVNPDQNSRNWSGRVPGVAQYADGFLASEDISVVVDNNVNVIGEFNQRPGWVYPGRALNGRPISELLTALWFDVRWKERVSRKFDEYDSRDEKFPVTLAGQLVLQGEAEAIISAGVSAGHFTSPEQVIIELPDITADDRDAQRIPINITIQTLTGAIQVASSVTFSREPLINEDE